MEVLEKVGKELRFRGLDCYFLGFSIFTIVIA